MKRGLIYVPILVIIICLNMAPPFERIARSLGKTYERLFAVFQFTYDFPQEEYVANLSYKRKEICIKGDFSPEMAAFLSSGQCENREILHQTKSRLTEKVIIKDDIYIVKTDHRKGFFRNLLKLSLGVRVWNNALWLKKMDIPSLTPVAVIEKRSWNFSESSIVYKCRGVDLANNKEILTNSSALIAHLYHSLVEKNVMHPDFQPRNVIREGDEGVFIIDIDCIAHYPPYSLIYQSRSHGMRDCFVGEAKGLDVAFQL